MLWAAVKEVIVFTSIQRSATVSSRPSTNSRPANGTAYRARLAALAPPESQAPASCGLAGTVTRISTKLAMSSSEKRMPATASRIGAEMKSYAEPSSADRGVRMPSLFMRL
jgi:hypothetical protein